VSVVCCEVEFSVSGDHFSRGVLPSVVCITECDREASIMKGPWLIRAVATLKTLIFHYTVY